MLNSRMPPWFLILSLAVRQLAEGRGGLKSGVSMDGLQNNWMDGKDYHRSFGPQFVFKEPKESQDSGYDKGYELRGGEHLEKNYEENEKYMMEQHETEARRHFENLKGKWPFTFSKEAKEQIVGEEEKVDYGIGYLQNQQALGSEKYGTGDEWQANPEKNQPRKKKFVAGFDNIMFIDEHIKARESGHPKPEMFDYNPQNFQTRHRSSRSREQFQKLLQRAG